MNSLFFPSTSSSSSERLDIKKIDFSSSTACNDIQSLLAYNIKDAKQCEEILQAITVLSSSSSNRLKFVVTSDTLILLLKAINIHASNRPVLEWGLKSLSALSIEAKAALIIVKNDGCRILTSTLQNGMKDDLVIEEISRIVYNISEEEDDSKIIFSELGLTRLLTVDVFIASAANLKLSTTEGVLRALGSLARRSLGNKELIASYGLCEVLVQTISNLFSPPDSLVEAACWAVGNLAYPCADNQTLLAQHMACEYILAVLEDHRASSELLQEAFRAIRNLCNGHEENLERLGQLGACELILTAITFSMHKGIQSGAVKETLSQQALSSPSPLLSASSLTGMIAQGSQFLQRVTSGTGGDPSSQPSESIARAHAVKGAVQWGWYALASLTELDSNLVLFRSLGIVKTVALSLQRYVLDINYLSEHS